MTQAFASDDERAAYEALAAEMKRGFRVDALWIKAMVEAGNDKVDAANYYARWRVGELLKELQDRRRADAERSARERVIARDRLKAQREDFARRFPLADEFEEAIRMQLFRDWSAGLDISERYAELAHQNNQPGAGFSVRFLLVAAVLFAVFVFVTTIIMNS